MYTLCVIDMQAQFHVSPDSAVAKNVSREIRQAIADDAYILFVEYKDCGDTLPELTDLVKYAGHTKVHTVTKKSDNGSSEIVSAINQHLLNDRRLKVVGVNTDCCVYSTVVGLQPRLPGTKVEIVADACDSNWSPDSHRRGIDNLRKLGCHIINGEYLQNNLFDPIKSIGDSA